MGAQILELHQGKTAKLGPRVSPSPPNTFLPRLTCYWYAGSLGGATAGDYHLRLLIVIGCSIGESRLKMLHLSLVIRAGAKN